MISPEWAEHDCCWMAWPKLGDEWPNGLDPIRAEVTALATEIAKSETIYLLVDPEQMDLPSFAPNMVPIGKLPYGDIWTRDTVPFRQRDGTVLCHKFNGWGDKYLFGGDDRLTNSVGEWTGAPMRDVNLILEGGGLEFDGAGRCLATRDSMLNDNRNPGLDEAEVTARLKKAYEVEQVLWLDGALTNDHTDGHIDTLARFVGPGIVLCVEPDDADPNYAAHRSIFEGLAKLKSAGCIDEILTIPAPGKLADESGTLLPISHLNFYFANHALLVPTYGVDSDSDVLDAMRSHAIADRPIVPISAREILVGGGAVHCITRDWPTRTTAA